MCDENKIFLLFSHVDYLQKIIVIITVQYIDDIRRLQAIIL